MKTFYLLRNEDIHGNSGVGVVAEGVIYWDGTGSFTWLTLEKTVTVFTSIQTIKKLHSHGGKTEVVVDGGHSKTERVKFENCRAMAQEKKLKLKQELKEIKKNKRGLK
jgi:hypothetical protein